MLIFKKYIIPLLLISLLVFVWALIDLRRQQDRAEIFSGKQMTRIVATESTLKEWGLPNVLLGLDLKRVDTNYTFSQWEIIFAVGEIGFVQVFVKPSNFIIIPILNFENDFEIDRIHFVQND